MACRITAPPQDRTGRYHGAADITDRWRCAPGTGAIAFRIAGRSALEPWSRNTDMTGAGTAFRAAKQPHQCVARDDAARTRTGMSSAAGAVNLPGRYPGEPDPWSLAAPDRTIAVPYPDGCAGERMAAGYHRDSKQKYCEHQPLPPGVVAVMRQGRVAMYRTSQRVHRL